jgi:hypothetical protein
MSADDEARRPVRNVAERAFYDAIVATVAGEPEPWTARGVAYRMLAQGIIGKTEQEFEKVRIGLVWLREHGEVGWDRIIDSARSVRGGIDGREFDPTDAVRASLKDITGFMAPLWETQPRQVQVWIEKDGLVPVVQAVTDRYRVPLLSGRGRSSITLVRQGFDLITRDTTVLMLFDYDPSGNDMATGLERDYRRWAVDLHIDFKLVALTAALIKKHRIQTRPTKARAAAFGPQSAELDAVPRPLLQDLTRTAIEAEIEPTAWRTARAHQDELNSEVKDIVADLIDTLR